MAEMQKLLDEAARTCALVFLVPRINSAGWWPLGAENELWDGRMGRQGAVLGSMQTCQYTQWHASRNRIACQVGNQTGRGLACCESGQPGRAQDRGDEARGGAAAQRARAHRRGPGGGAGAPGRRGGRAGAERGPPEPGPEVHEVQGRVQRCPWPADGVLADLAGTGQAMHTPQRTGVASSRVWVQRRAACLQ